MDIGILIGLIGMIIGIPGLILSWPSIKNRMKSLRSRNVLLLFGPKGSGKSTLRCYLQGKSLPDYHSETHSFERTGKIVYDLSGNSTFFFTIKDLLDIGGEFGSYIRPLIEKDNPHAVVFVCDLVNTSAEKRALGEVIKAIEAHLVATPVEELRLKLLMILLNKCDIWGEGISHQNEMKCKYRDEFLADDILFIQELVPGLVVQIRPVSLTHPSFQLQTDAALREMAMLLEEGGR